MKKKISAMLMALLLLFTTVATLFGESTPVKAEGQIVIKLHYHRDDGDYASWDVWSWPSGGEGAAYTFDETDENGDGVATLPVEDGATSIGYIVRTAGSWDAKDVDADQFIDVTEMVSGTLHFYVESGVADGTKEYGDDAVIGVKPKSAEYSKDSNQITVEMTNEPEDTEGAFTVEGVDGEIEITGIQCYGSNVVLSLGEQLDAYRNYTVTYDGTTISVNMARSSAYSSEEFEEAYTYTGDDLGATWSADSTTFRVWAPTAEAMSVNLYSMGTAGSGKADVHEMTPDVNGTWVATVDGDLNGTYYTYSVTIGGETSETADPYAKSAGVNGDRSMVIDLDSTDPEGWENDSNPNADLDYNDAIIYELQLRDLASDESSNIEDAGTYLSLTEHGTTTDSGIPTGIDHIKDLGITHLHLQPVYDFGSVDEATGGYNWGYDPQNYNVPEGSYSSNPYDGTCRVSEFKTMVQSLHNDGISVVMDVVYNHVYAKDEFCYNILVPDYFSRVSDNGVVSSGSGCGNDTASERAMVKKYIVDSVLYWTEEYHIDGFRFDLVGLLDTETMNEVIEEVHAVRPDVIFYGEGWTLTTFTTKDDVELATQANSTDTPELAFFSDNIRDALKGSVFDDKDTGFVTGSTSLNGNLESAWLGASGTWCKSPSQSVNYASCHDNMTLWDRINNVCGSEDEETLIRRNDLAAAVVMTSQGIPFMMAGEEMLRSKVNEDGSYNTNSYNAGDEVNSIKWDSLDDENCQTVYNYYKGLIAFRKLHAGLRLSTAEEVEAYVSKLSDTGDLIAYQISGDATDEVSDGILVAFNNTEESIDLTLPEGSWGVCVKDTTAGTEAFETAEGTITVDPISTVVLVKNLKVGESGAAEADQSTDASETGKPSIDRKGAAVVGYAILASLVFFGIVAGVSALIRKGKEKDKDAE